MPTVDVVVETQISRSARARQLEGMFDVPAAEKQRLEWKGDIAIEDRDWNIGLIVGPSGCGKTTILEHCFGHPKRFKWGAASVVDDFEKELKIEDIAKACSSVGFNTIPNWLRPYKVLSNGEKFRVEIARRLLETDGLIVLDEFTSVVDRQVAQITSAATAKMVRKKQLQLVAASCHFDIIDWLEPDWIYEPATNALRWRRLRGRPTIDCVIGPVPYAAWQLFAPFHYLTRNLNKAARCFGLWVEGRLAAFSGVLHHPHPTARNIKRLSRTVVLPDFQGLGLVFALNDRLASAYKALGQRFRCYPAHPGFIRSFDRSPHWSLKKRPGRFSPRTGQTSSLVRAGQLKFASNAFGGRPCAVFQWCGPAMDKTEAKRLVG